MKWAYLKFIVIGGLVCLMASLLVFSSYGIEDTSVKQKLKENDFTAQRQRALENQSKFFSPRSPWVKEIYIVKPGDSLYQISRLFGITVQLLKQVNDLVSDTIHP